MCIELPPKHAVASVIGYLKGQSAIARHFAGGDRHFAGEHFWARGAYSEISHRCVMRGSERAEAGIMPHLRGS
jgi:hypothetical protein